ncbi:sugar-binding domain-containing protein [Limibacter armeniacum]|uniref:sugar-binding domain-containing protein n=1 Tax=Limibacter armeniacum TaxID=466084 RepID=UPI002FE5FAC5
MKRIFYLIAIFLIVSCSKQTEPMQRVNDFNFDWKFKLTEQDLAQSPVAISFDDQQWESLNLPHDWVIEHPYDTANANTAPATGYIYGGGIGWYRKHFNLNLEDHQKAFIVFDGVYNHSEVFLNGQKLGGRPYGYVPFQFDMTPYLNKDGKENILAVKVDHTRYADSRWYTGAGIYRNVELVVTDKLHVPVWGTFVTTPEISEEQAMVQVATTVSNQYKAGQTFTLKTEILDAQGQVVSETEEKQQLSAASENTFDVQVAVKKPRLWDIESPYMYTARTTILNEGKQLEEVLTKFGVREIRFDPDSGFFLNGQNRKIKGVCLHHDAGLVGTAVPKGVWRRRLQLLKDGGCNAIRISHNPGSQEFLDLCDEMGFLVQDEFFDEWDNPKDKRWNQKERKQEYVTEGYALQFQEWAEQDLKNTVLAHRNHPSIFQWSIGNEIEWTYPRAQAATGFFNNMNWSGNYFWSEPPFSPEQIKKQLETLPKGKYDIGTTASKLVKWTKEMDTTRPVIANCILPSASHLTDYGKSLDIVGYSYRRVLYDYGHELYPDKVIMGTENLAQYHEWKAIMERPFIAGTFFWTGIHYMGEIRGPWPQKGSGSGMVDFAGFPNPSYHMIKTLWTDKPHTFIATQQLEKSINKIDPATGKLVAKKPDAWKQALWNWHKVNNHWNYPEGQMISVEIYSNCDEIELFLNDRSLGKRTLDEFEDHIYKWGVAFETGELKAVGTKDGETQVTYLNTAGNPVGVTLVADRTHLKTDGYDVAHVVAQLVDAAGNPVSHTERKVTFNLPEGVRLLGVDNGALENVQLHRTNELVTHQGRALLVLQSIRSKEGQVDVSVSSDGLKGDQLKLVLQESDNKQDNIEFASVKN